MSQVKRIYKTRCSKCLKNRSAISFKPVPSGVVIKRNKRSAKLKCPICGHEWVSRSKAGRRLAT